MRILLGNMTPINDVFVYFMLLSIVLIWTVIKYSFKVTSFIGIWTLNCLLSSTYTELMSVCHRMREGYISKCHKYFPKKHLISMHCMIGVCLKNLI